MRRHLRRFITPVSRHLPALRAAARIVSQSPLHGLKLLIQTQISPGLQADPDLYPFARFLAEMFGCTNVLIVGKPSAHELIELLPHFRIAGSVNPEALNECRRQFPMVEWVAAGANGGDAVSEKVLQRPVIICSRAIDEADPTSLLPQIKKWLDHAPVCLLTTATKDLAELEELLREQQIDPMFIGLTASDNASFEKNTVLAVLQNNSAPRALETFAPPDFRVLALMAAYNEEDIIVQSIKKWTDQGMRVHILENWSTDATYDLIQQLAAHLPVTVERFPQSGPSPYFDWAAILQRIEQLSLELEADWFVRRGVDEVLVAPWPGLSYRDGLYLVDRSGFNCVDHINIEFPPVDEGFAAGLDHEEYFRHFDFHYLSHHWQRKAWKNCGQRTSTIATAGHDVAFEGRRIYPFKFLDKHYSFRSQAHGEKKVFRERKPRWNPDERARGWHIHYDSIKEGHCFLQSPADKDIYDEEDFNKRYLIERLSGIGVSR